jgi:DNA-binding HxlR family transcriptional regulator
LKIGELSASGGPVRAGARLLTMATSSIKREILRELSDRPIRWGGNKEAKITAAGREMLFVAFIAELWLQNAPTGPLPFDSDEGQRAVTALVDGWSSTIVHALAAQPLTLQELERTVECLSRRALKRRLAALQRSGQVKARPGEGQGAIYTATDWLRSGIAPLAVAARLERRNPTGDMVPIAPLDIEAGFLLTLPLIELPSDLSGSCRLGVELGDGKRSCLAGITARVEGGRVTECAVRLDDGADAWAIASVEDWLDTVIEPDAKRVRSGGNRHLARALIDGLHGSLFGIPVKR